MESITYTNQFGESVTFGGPPFYLQKINGLGDVTANIQTQRAPYQDGSTFIDVLIDEREIPIEFLIVNAFDEGRYGTVSERRASIARVLNPKFGPGILRYENEHLVREILVIADSVPVYPDDVRTKSLQKGLVNFVAPSPFWEDINSENYKLEDFVGNFRFKFRFPVRFATRGDSRILINKGDVPTPIVVEFRGAAVNPKITNVSTGEFIRVNRTIPPGYKLVLETTFGNKRVEIIAPDGVVENGFPWIDPESSFFNLDVGETKFSFITEGGNPEVYVEYKHRYLSV